jgi:restriction endonuclease S subunit
MKYRIRKQDELKPSGVEWLGDIPKNWIVSRLKYVFKSMISGGTPNSSDEKNYTDFENGIPFISISDMSKSDFIYKTSKSLTTKGLAEKNLTILEEGTLIYSIFATIGKVAELKIKAVTNQALLGLTLIDENQKQFVKYYLNFLENHVLSFSTSNTQNNINLEKFKNFPILFSIEQQKIANFLDEKSKIFDEAISRKEQLISKLELAKQSLISEVVTGKLKIIENNSKLQSIKREQNELKPSGVECLGDIPKEWEIKKFKYIIKLNPNKFNLDEKIKNDIEVSFVPMENVRRGNINLDNIKNINSVICGYTFFEEDDILIAKVTPCFENHNCAIAKNLKNKIGFGSTELNVLRCFNKDSIKFVYYYVQTDLFINLGVSQMTGTGGLKRVPSSFFENFKISFPTITEQQKISKYLDEKLIHFDNTIEKTKQSIKKLKLAKEALISQAVTGKIEVL